MGNKENIIDKYICQECGLPFILYSHEIKDNNKDSEKIYISLFCRNSEHKEIKKYDFEDYYDNILKNNYQKICKCLSCNKLICDKIPNYCYSCRKIICSDCINNCKEKGHSNIFKYDDLINNNKCFIHSGNDNIYYCLECKNMMCQICYLNHIENINYHTINNLKSFYQNNFSIIKEQEKSEEIIKTIKRLENKKHFIEFLMKDNNNFCSLRNNINISEINTFTNISDQKDIDYSSTNIIYHDGNFNKDEKVNNILRDSRNIQKKANASLILTKNLDELKLVLQFMEKNQKVSLF